MLVFVLTVVRYCFCRVHEPRLPFPLVIERTVFGPRKRENRFTFSVLSGILTPKTDTCLTARTALTLIATSRSNVVIITLARELAKHALAQSGTASSALPGTIKNEQKNEILRLMKILIEKCPHDVAELILEVRNERLRSKFIHRLILGRRYYSELHRFKCAPA